MDEKALDTTIRSVLTEHGGLARAASQVADDDDLYQLGLSSHGTVNVMLALEDAFSVEFPDTMMSKSTFRSVSTIRAALSEVLGER